MNQTSPRLYDHLTHRDADDGIYYAAHGSDECDRCHLEPGHFELADDEPGEWTYCLPCARKLSVAKMRATP